MKDSKPVYIISDSPEKESGLFGFDAYAKTIAGLIAFKENKTPLVIGIYGPWGSGKTTLMETVRSTLKKEEYKDKNVYRPCKTVWFQAWKYGKEEEILAALIEEIFKTIKRDKSFIQRVKGELEEFISKMDVSKGVGKIAKHFIGLDVADFISEPGYKAKLGFYDTFQDFFDRLLWTYTNLLPKLSSTEEPNDQKGALVIFIDDLDRCPRPRILNVLETIKLFMDKRGCVFVIGAANEIIETALAETYKEDAGRFMEKIVQVTFKLPPIPEEDFKSFVKKIDPEINEAIFPHLALIMPAMQNNPRQFKRFLNNLNLLDGLLKNNSVEIDFNHLLFWNIIDLIYPVLGKDIKEHPENLFTLQEHIKSFEEKIGDEKRWEISQEELKQVPQSFHGYIQNKELVDIVMKFTIDRDTLKQLRSLSGAVETAEDLKEKEVKAREYGSDLADMADVPAGAFKYGDEKESVNIERAFKIDIYPVTNSQFEKFVQGGGYEKDDYWSKEGQEWRQKNDITLPRYWDDEKWNQPEHPVVGVSFYEAEAYARWAGKSLPTEQQWERVARGTDGRAYPWGDEFDKERCNTAESGIGKTTRVTRYPNGISLSGCYDMAGNVWEWTKSKEGDLYLLRGGSWYINQEDARCASRNWIRPITGLNYVGFRCVRNQE